LLSLSIHLGKRYANGSEYKVGYPDCKSLSRGYKSLRKTGAGACTRFFKVGGYEMILLSVLEEVLLPAAHPEKQ
jgi:hypothetical protein